MNGNDQKWYQVFELFWILCFAQEIVQAGHLFSWMNDLALWITWFYDKLKTKPCGLGFRIQDVEVFWHKTEIKIISFVPLIVLIVSDCMVCVWWVGNHEMQHSKIPTYSNVTAYVVCKFFSDYWNEMNDCMVYPDPDNRNYKVRGKPYKTIRNGLRFFFSEARRWFFWSYVIT